MLFRKGLCLMVLFLAGAVRAQLPTVDIAMVALPDGRLEVRMRPDQDFDGFFAQLTFTIRWDAASSASVGDFTPTDDVAEYGMNPNLSGTIVTSGAYKYAPFVGLGGSPLFAVGLAWTADQEFILGHFDVTDGPANFQIVNDDWTAANNGAYYVSLNGEDRTGVIYEITTTVEERDPAVSALELLPNPSSGGTRLALEVPSAGSVRVEVLDASGRVSMTNSFAVPSGRSEHYLDGSALAAGMYQVRITGPGLEATEQWMILHP
jgi:hypothetical protein